MSFTAAPSCVITSTVLKSPMYLSASSSISRAIPARSQTIILTLSSTIDLNLIARFWRSSSSTKEPLALYSTSSIYAPIFSSSSISTRLFMSASRFELSSTAPKAVLKRCSTARLCSGLICQSPTFFEFFCLSVSEISYT
ncbi:MAG: hypothetical protein IJ062_04740 [Firmicutes bacterium]|nr:hypothetical protein [Bacillota bacterium]